MQSGTELWRGAARNRATPRQALAAPYKAKLQAIPLPRPALRTTHEAPGPNAGTGHPAASGRLGRRQPTTVHLDYLLRAIGTCERAARGWFSALCASTKRVVRE